VPSLLAVGPPPPTAAGKVVAGAQDWGALVAGLAITAGCVVLGARYYRRARSVRSP
jgi:hypothetical protein